MKVRLQNELKPRTAKLAFQDQRGRKKFKKTSKTLGELVRLQPKGNLS